MDINEIMNRAKAAQAQALESLHKAEEKSEALAASLSPEPDASPQNNAALEAEQPAANARRQGEILGQVFAGCGGFSGSRHWFILIYRCFPVIRCVRTYRETRRKGGGTEPLYVRTQRLALLPHIL